MTYEYNYVKLRQKFFPLLPIRLEQGNEKIDEFALVDSGASISLFKPEIAYQLGIDVGKGKKLLLEGISGKITIYLHEVLLSIEEYKFICKIGFSEEYTASFNLLGRDNFFRHFAIIFEEKDKKLRLER